jgi:hypothetical protein
VTPNDSDNEQSNSETPDHDQLENDSSIRAETPPLPPLVVEYYNPDTLQQKSKPVSGRRIVQLDYFIQEILKLAALDHGRFGCGPKNLEIIFEKREGFRSCITLKCSMCNMENKVRTEPLPDSAPSATPKDPGINEAVVTSAMSSGITYGIMSDFLGGALNIPVFSATTYHKIHNKIEDKIFEASVQEMVAAGNKEREIAEAKGQYVTIKGEQVPWITVIADGTWLRRSYKGNYASLQGAVSKIVIFLVAIYSKYMEVIWQVFKKNSSIS